MKIGGCCLTWNNCFVINIQNKYGFWFPGEELIDFAKKSFGVFTLSYGLNLFSKVWCDFLFAHQNIVGLHRLFAFCSRKEFKQAVQIILPIDLE
jgi:hypothetical protein